MNKSLIKFITDFGPLLIFFIFYKKYGMQQAILPLIIATAISILFIYLTEKKVPTMPLISGILLAGFGGLTLYFNDKTFFPGINFSLFIHSVTNPSLSVSYNLFATDMMYFSDPGLLFKTTCAILLEKAVLDSFLFKYNDLWFTNVLFIILLAFFTASAPL